MTGEVLQNLYGGIRTFAGTGAVVVLFLTSLLVFVISKKDRGLLPAALSPLGLIGMAASRFIEAAAALGKKRIAKYATAVFAILICALAITSSGSLVFSSEFSEKAENDMHIRRDLTDAMDVMLSDTGEPRVLAMPGWGNDLTNYSSRFSLMYDEPSDKDFRKLSSDAQAVYIQLLGAHPDMGQIAAAARRSGCDYVLLSTDLWPDVPLSDCGFEVIYENDSCTVYREVSTP